MKHRVVVPLPDGFEEIEATTVVDVLRRAEIDVVTAGLGDRGVARGAHGIDVVPDAHIDDLVSEGVTAVVLPGGMPGSSTLAEDQRVQALLKTVAAAGGWTCAICAAPMALGAAGVIADRRVTSYPGFEDRIECGEYLDARVVVDGPVITSRSPGTALEFALALVARFADEVTAQRLAEAMLVERSTEPFEA